MVKEIPLQNGMVALVDDEDYERCIKHYWVVSKISETTIAVTTNVKIDNKIISISLQQFILQMNSKKKNIISFKDNNRLNYQKGNLISGDRKIVARKSRGQRNTSSKYKGVTLIKKTSKWRATIKVQGVLKHLGCFINEDDAAKAYNEAAIKYFGEHVYLNIIGKDNNATVVDMQTSGHLPRTKRNKKSIYRGVSFGENNTFFGYIRDKRKQMHLGTYYNEVDAARAYDKKAYELHGDKAILNFPEEYKKSI